MEATPHNSPPAEADPSRAAGQLLANLEPFVHKLDQQVIAVRTSQQLLMEQLCRLLAVLDSIKQQQLATESETGAGSATVYARQTAPVTIDQDIEDKSRRLLGLKRRLTLVHSILQTVNSRVKKLLLAHDSRRMLAGTDHNRHNIV